MWFFFLSIVGIQSVLAQSYTVKGTVLSKSDNEPLIGVSILQKGTMNGVITDFDGNYVFEIQGSGDAVLVFSYIGMQTQELKVTPKTGVLNVEMQDDSQLVDEVVVVAYGVRKKGTIAGSVSTVKADKLENVPTASFDQALQGQTPGLSVMAASGEPSRAATFQIRGTNSINSGTSPLFILDGVPVESSSFNALNPSDIESISVLKDASSTSIYGARAANGVVVITTKRGRNVGNAVVSLKGQWGFSRLAGNNWDMMNTEERIQYEKEIGLDLGDDYYNRVRGIDVNWLDEVFNKFAPTQSYELSVNGATDKTNYFVSGGFFDQDGITIGSTFKRYNMRANVENRAKDWLKLGTNTLLAYEEIEQAEDGEYALYAPISASHFMLPYWSPYNSDGSLASSNDGTWTGTGQNPIEWMENNPVKHKTYKIISSMFAEVTPIERLVIRSQFGVDYSHSTAFMQSFPSYIINNNSGTAGRSSTDGLTLTITNTANYMFDIDRKHNFNFLLGQEGVNYYAESFQAVTAGQTNDALTNMASGSHATSWTDATTEYAFLSFFGRGEYNYDGKYYADFSIRTDASSRFGKGNRWAGFWSVGLMWDARKENFLKGYDWLSNAQLTFSTGTSGNSSIPDFDQTFFLKEFKTKKSYKSSIAEELLQDSKNTLYEPLKAARTKLAGEGKGLNGGSIKEILDLYKQILPANEFAKLQAAAGKSVKKLDKAIDTDALEYFDKYRDLVLGSAPTDTLSVLSSLGAVVWGLSNAEDKNERTSVLLNVGLPIVGSVATTLYFTARLVSGFKSLALGALSGFIFSQGGSIADNFRQKHLNNMNLLAQQSPKESI